MIQPKDCIPVQILLKQGWYDYQYLVKSPTASCLPTLKEVISKPKTYYEIFVYNRPFQPRADLLIGYIQT